MNCLYEVYLDSCFMLIGVMYAHLHDDWLMAVLCYRYKLRVLRHF